MICQTGVFFGIMAKIPRTRMNYLNVIHFGRKMEYTVRTRLYKTPSFGNQPVLFPMQRCCFWEQPEKFFKSVHKKLLYIIFCYCFSAIL